MRANISVTIVVKRKSLSVKECDFLLLSRSKVTTPRLAFENAGFLLKTKLTKAVASLFLSS